MAIMNYSKYLCLLAPEIKNDILVARSSFFPECGPEGKLFKSREQFDKESRERFERQELFGGEFACMDSKSVQTEGKPIDIDKLITQPIFNFKGSNTPLWKEKIT